MKNNIIKLSSFCVFGLILLAKFVTAAESTNVMSAHSADPVDKEGYSLQIGDRVKIKIFPADEYIKGGEYQIGPSGNINMPFLGRVKIDEMSLSEAAHHLAKIIDKDYIVNPEVVIEVSQQGIKRSFTILGQVRGPGTYDFPIDAKHFTLLKAISRGGGFSDVANIKKIKIIRVKDDENQVMRINAEDIIKGKKEDILIFPEDTIHVSESFF